MRMRKLGKGQSVMFFALMEVEHKIMNYSRKKSIDIIEVADVLQRSIAETCSNMKKCIPLWATQGLRFQRHHVAWAKSSESQDEATVLECARSLLEPEAKSLQDRYGFVGKKSEELILLTDKTDESLSTREIQIGAIRAKCQEFQLASLRSAALQEERERELHPEEEQERQVQRPRPLSPRRHSIHQQLKDFVSGYPINLGSGAF